MDAVEIDLIFMRSNAVILWSDQMRRIGTVKVREEYGMLVSMKKNKNSDEKIWSVVWISPVFVTCG